MSDACIRILGTNVSFVGTIVILSGSKTAGPRKTSLRESRARNTRERVMKRQTTLERKMLSYFGLIAAASLLITIEFIWAIRGAIPGPESLAGLSAASESSIREMVQALQSLQNKALLMCVVQAVVTLIVLIMFMRRITGPLQQMVESSQIISEGDLSKTIPVRSRDEIGRLGETINALTSNFQELVALGLATESSLRSSLEGLRERIPPESAALESVEEMETELEGFRWIIDDFKLFPAPGGFSESESKR